MVSIMSSVSTRAVTSPSVRRAKGNGPVDSTIGWSGTGTTMPPWVRGTAKVSWSRCSLRT